MLKRVMAVFVAALIVLAVAGCGRAATEKTEAPAAPTVTQPAGPGPSSADLNDTAVKVLKLTESRDWAALYDYFSADIQKTITKDEFVALKKEESAHSKIVYKNFKVGQPRMLAQWEDKMAGKSYQNVAEVPYTVDVQTPKGEMHVNNTINLIQTPEKNWRYLWIRKN